MAVIKIKDLTYYYPDAPKPALDSISLEIPAGQFLLLVGGSGCGKSTLVRALAGLIPDFYGGAYGGEVCINNQPIRQLEKRELVRQVGMVFQDPESQLVMNDVEQEVAFGLENIGLSNSLMKRRVMEVTGALALSGCLHSFIPELSGGQKQKVALASVLAMQPEILVLDEPTSQLDPIVGEEILTMIRRLNEENGLTVILVEQRLERCFHLADRVLVMENGRIDQDGAPDEVARRVVKNDTPFIPPLARLFAGAGYPDVPLTVKRGREILKSFNPFPHWNRQNRPGPKSPENRDECLVDIQNLWFTFPNGKEVLKNINLKIRPGDFTVIMGENAAGKTTLLKNINGLLKPGRGQVKVLNRDTGKLSVEELASTVGYLSQDPNDYLFLPTVREELAFTLNNLGLSGDRAGEETLAGLKLTPHAEANPRDLSAGERQRVALASVLVARPRLLLLDEPTRGLDYRLKAQLGNILRELQANGKAVLVVTHDVEFAAEYADNIVLMAGGMIIADGGKYEMLTRSTFYSPQISKLFNNIVDGVVTLEQGGKLLTQLQQLNKNKG
ncbi:MAG: energy-coupling factor transporter ATPase [Firmicutes bacterium]|nr:energy-coupling factor transporter ATPase [Bacillota bacterium]